MTSRASGSSHVYVGFGTMSSQNNTVSAFSSAAVISVNGIMRYERLKLQCSAGMQFRAIRSIFQYSGEKDGEEGSD